jgi:hypothetical protein
MTKKIEPLRRQKTIYYSSDVGRDGSLQVPKPFGDYYTHMFIEDTSLGVMPIGAHARRPRFKVQLAPSDPTTEQMVASAVSNYRRSYRKDLASEICEFFRQCAAQIVAFDQSTYEIVYFEEPTTKKAVGFELVFVDEGQLVRKSGNTYQVVSAAVAKERGVPELIPLEENDMIVFKTPARYRKALHRVREGLSQLGDMSMAKFALEASQAGIPYDFKAHERSMKLALADVVRPIGWTARGTFNESVLSYYQIQMEIRFHEFKIEIREAMLASLNSALSHIGRQMGFEAKLQIHGLPTLDDAQRACQALSSGNIAFTELMKVFDQN